jgi:hypothetical protein
MHYPGDARGKIKVGELMGPGDDGFMREVLEVVFDPFRRRTRVEFKRVHVAPEGQRLMYYGGVDEDLDPPEPRAALEHREVPR